MIYEILYMLFHSKLLNILLLVACVGIFLSGVFMLVVEAIVISFHLGKFDLLSTIVFLVGIILAIPFMRYYYRMAFKRPLTQPYK